uniref:SET domain-containing protein n=1 Tax=Panagrolaimus superbus TaxID=310955 RepID=A0A914YSV1_9BILA
MEKCDFGKKKELNRIVVDPMSIDFYQEFYVECGMHCGCQGKCRRRIFPGSHAAKKLHVEYFLNKGFGVVVDQPVAAGMPVCEYRGLVCIRETDLIQPSHYQQDLLYDNDGNFYVVDAVNDGSVARFINHSCSANLVQINVYSSIPSQKKIPPPPRVALVACRDILAGTELTFNYGVAYFHDRHLRCFCYELCCLIPADDWALKTKNERETTQEINYAKRHIETHFDETKDVEPECIDLSD